MPTADCFAWESFNFDDSEVESPPPPLLPTSARQPTKPSNTSTSRMRQPPPIKKIHRRLPPPVWGGRRDARRIFGTNLSQLRLAWRRTTRHLWRAVDQQSVQP